MAHLSKIERLQAEIRERIGQMRQAGATIDDITAFLRDAGHDDISRSAVGRHVQELDAIGARMREQRSIAEALMARLGAEPDDKLFRLNVELMHGLLFRLAVAQQDGGEVQFSPNELMFLTSALKNLAGASKTDVDRIARVEKRATDQATKRAAEAVDKVGKTQGLSRDTIAMIKAEFLGVQS